MYYLNKTESGLLYVNTWDFGCPHNTNNGWQANVKCMLGHLNASNVFDIVTEMKCLTFSQSIFFVVDVKAILNIKRRVKKVKLLDFW